jgi:hypothetical protein
MTYKLAEASITCNFCKRTSYHPQDIENLFCGACKIFHQDKAVVLQMLIDAEIKKHHENLPKTDEEFKLAIADITASRDAICSLDYDSISVELTPMDSILFEMKFVKFEDTLLIMVDKPFFEPYAIFTMMTLEPKREVITVNYHEFQTIIDICKKIINERD